uniref:uncharacterized abhydrolase domain-containing protein DDB_G0269086-like n=1 Tax=Semicossyphus pulcher TaxID=241346 RepID=UPI0037E7262E
MGRKLDLSGLSDNEAEHVLQVVQRDMKLRKKEEERLSELKQELDDEGSRCLLLSRQGFFNQRCCIRCCSPFTFLLNPRRKCRDCKYNVCKACRVYSKREKAWLCSSCEKSRLLKTQSLEWFYTNVKTRFKRFGSAKVLKTLYRKHLVEHSALSELTEGSAYEESICNEGSICGSDSAFYRQSEEHSMEETFTVALRVAEEAIDEAITKAEFDTSSQEKQNEANYLREHKGELVEELAKTIVQKIINRRKALSDMRADYVKDWPAEHNTDLHQHHQASSDHATSSVKQQPGLFRSHSAYSLLENDSPGVIQDSSQASMKEDGGPAMTAWKSVDRLDNAGVSAVLHSMDGNWIALQSAQLSRPSLLTKRKSQVYSALERESAVVSAYEGMGSDNETKPDPESSLGAAIQEIHRKMMDSNINLQDTCDRILSPLMSRRGSGDRMLSPKMGRRNSRDNVLSDSEGNWKPNKPLLGVIKMKVPAEIRRPTSRRTSIIDVNFNLEGARQEENKGAAEPDVRKVEKSQKNKKSEKESSSSVLDNSKNDNHPSDAVTPDTLTSGAMTTPEPESDITGQGANQMEQELTLKLQELAGRVQEEEEVEEVDGARDSANDGQMEEEKEENEDRDEEDERLRRMEIESDGGRTEDEEKDEDEKEEDDEEMNYRLNKLVAQSRLTYFSSTDDELNKVGQSEEESEGDKDEDMEEEHEEPREEKTNGFTYKLCQLEKEVRANQFSSTEDEMDRVGVADEEKTGEEEDEGKNVELAVKVCRLAYQVNANQFSSTEDELDSVGLLDEDMRTGEEEEEEGKNEELALKVCRLAHQVNANQFSSTEDELDRVGRGEEEEEATDEETLWKLQAEKAVQAAQLRDLASLVGVTEQEVHGEVESGMWEDAEGNNQDKEESFEDLDVNMFDLRDEIEEKKKGNGDENVTSDEVLEAQDDKTQVEEKRNGTEECEALNEGAKVRDTKERQEMELKPAAEGEKNEETKVQQENLPERQEEDKIGANKDSQGSWESEEEHSEEYEEFDRIISSMLMMTLEDMQVQTMKDEAAENGNTITEPEEAQAEENVKIAAESGLEKVQVVENVTLEGESEFKQQEVDENVKKEGESGLEEQAVDAQSTEAPKETGSEKELQSPSENMMPESAVKETPGGNVSREEESGDAASGKEKKVQKKDTEVKTTPAKKSTVMSIKEMLETFEAKQLCKRIGLHDDRQEDRGGKVSTMRLTMETQGEAADTKEKLEESQEQKVHNKVQSRRSSLQEAFPSPEEIQIRYSAVSLRNVTTEVLKVLNTAEDLLQGVKGGDRLRPSIPSLPPNTDPKKLDQQFSKLEEKVYVAAGSVYSLEAELGDLEEVARGISGATSDMELSFLEEQVASAAAKVQQSDQKIYDISSRIAALKNAGLNVDTQSRPAKTRTIPVMPVTLDSSRQFRRRLPAPPPVKDKET